MKHAVPENLPTKKFPLKKMRIFPLFGGMDTCAKLNSLAVANFFAIGKKNAPLKSVFS